ncbi:MAG: hypothetical protein EPO21_21885 [Chloroflexota bacterium]|nr:MAG: hypothetical protein EPO21_21885 [Chloroflexota bacterium]
MADQVSSPFSGLDKALLRSTQQPSPLAPEERKEGAKPSATPRAARKTPSRQPTTNKNDSATDSAIASTLDSMLAPYPDSLIASIRKTVKIPGREVSFVRLTAEEKGQLADIVYTYKRQGKKTSENEINRIAVNYILEDYRANGANSILAQVIEALLA